MKAPRNSRLAFHLLGISLFILACMAVAQTRQPAFDVATVRAAPPHSDPSTGYWSPPGRGEFFANHVTLALLLQLAYGINNSQIANQPDWLETDLFDVVAKAEDGASLSRDELKPRLQDLLRQRFHLAAHMESRASRGYALVIAKNGPHLLQTKGDHFPGYRINVSPGQMRGVNWSTPQLAKYLASASGFPVVDQTGLHGSYDIGFSYSPNPDAEDAQPNLNEALKQATGLMLKPQKIPVETLVIDSVDRTPTVN